ncbi:MAG: cell division protein FtsW [Bradymonadia bacterium]|jgi:cell division protein FtsW
MHRPPERPLETFQRGPIDVSLLFVTACLVCLGLLAVYNGSAFSSYFHSANADDLIYFRKQATGAVMGTAVLLAAMRIDYRIYQRHIYWMVGLSLSLLVLTHVPGIGHTVNGAARWIRVGVTFQPAELAKITAVFYLAYSITKKGANVSKFIESFAAHGMIFLPFLVLLMLQPDLGSSVVICLLVAIMLYVGGARMAYMMGFIGLGFVALWAAIQGKSYRLDRIAAWLDPWADADGVGYHLVNSYIALARGGVTGTGFGEGGGRLGYIPELYNDFVAASVGEEFGLVGLGLLAVLYILFVWRGMAISRNAKDTFGAYLAFGITMLIGVQAAINLCVVTGVLPTKGLTLPFVSYGRSSLILLLFAVGVLQNIAQCNPDFYKMRLDDLKVQDAAAEKRSKAERTRERRRRRKLKELGADD